MSDIDSTTPRKKCTKCGEEKPATTEYFFGHKTGKQGLRAFCKNCHADEQREYQKKRRNPDYQNQRINSADEKEAQKNEGVKRCSKCRQIKPCTAEYFARHKKAKDGLSQACKECDKKHREATRDHRIAYNRKYYQDNQEKLQADAREREQAYRKANPNKYRQRSRDQYRKHRQRYLKACQNYQFKNRDWINERKRSRYHENIELNRARDRARQSQRTNNPDWQDYQRNYRLSHREMRRVYRHNRRASKKALPNTFTHNQWLLCLEYWGYSCAVCGYPFVSVFGRTTKHADHWIAINDKRPDNPGTVSSNMICLCDKCNSSKKDSDPEYWLSWRYTKHKAKKILRRIKAYFDWIKQQ